MTTIAYDGKMLVADGRGCSCGRIVSDDFEKIRFNKTDKPWTLCGIEFSAFGISGEYHYADYLVDLLESGDESRHCKHMAIPEDADFEILAVAANGAVYHGCTTQGCDYFAMSKVSVPASIGSGSHLAIGAMAAGKPAIDSVRIAMKFDPDTGGTLSSYNEHTRHAALES